jgi:NAD(P)-dependent dehydrogenase (short-subunit alcohol dehydrogenase family)
MDLTGKVAVVTGASKGVGLAIADALTARGMLVATVARHNADFIADVSDPAAVARLKQEVEEKLGVPTVLVNNAGVFGPIALIEETDPSEWVETIQINTIGPYLLCREFMRGMQDAGWGRIINVSSAASLGEPGMYNSAYATAKVALNQFTRNLAAELDGTGVSANVIHPGDVKTVRENTSFVLRHFVLKKRVYSPRQARDKHQEI